jgi:hypothetical protein
MARSTRFIGDECGDWTISGSRGEIRACDGTFYVYVRCRSVRHWNHAKKQFAGFATVHQDGDDEGVLLLTRMPNADEAATIRGYVGLHQTRNVGPDHGDRFHRSPTKTAPWPVSSFKAATG